MADWKFGDDGKKFPSAETFYRSKTTQEYIREYQKLNENHFNKPENRLTFHYLPKEKS